MAETYYDSELTGKQLDEAFGKLANLEKSVMQADSSARTAQQYGQIVEQNAQAIEDIEANLSAIKASQCPGRCKQCHGSSVQCQRCRAVQAECSSQCRIRKKLRGTGPAGRPGRSGLVCHGRVSEICSPHRAKRAVGNHRNDGYHLDVGQ